MVMNLGPDTQEQEIELALFSLVQFSVYSPNPTKLPGNLNISLFCGSLNSPHFMSRECHLDKG